MGATSIPESACLEARAVAFGYRRGTDVLRGADLRLASGRIIALVGDNGAGKSTLIDLITGYLRPSGGKLSLGETSLLSLAPYQIRRLGVSRTFQRGRLIRRLTVRQNLELVHRTARSDPLRQTVAPAGASTSRESVVAILDALDLTDRVAETLSYGEQKLASVVAALYGSPKFVLLDEPVAGVSPRLQIDIAGCIQRAAEDGVGVLVVEHDWAVLARLRSIDFYMLNRQGRVVPAAASMARRPTSNVSTEDAAPLSAASEQEAQ